MVNTLQNYTYTK